MCVQNVGTLAHWNPHLHLLLCDGAATATIAWPHSGFSAHVGAAIAGDDREAMLRVARYCAGSTVAESRPSYDAARAEVELAPGKSDGPRAGMHRITALECIARWLGHVPERYLTRVRYDGAYATRRRVCWHRAGIVLMDAPPAELGAVEPTGDWPVLRARRRRQAEPLRRVFKVEVEVCQSCGGAMRIVAFITELATVRRILTPLERGGISFGACQENRASPLPGPILTRMPPRGSSRREGRGRRRCWN